MYQKASNFERLIFALCLVSLIGDIQSRDAASSDASNNYAVNHQGKKSERVQKGAVNIKEKVNSFDAAGKFNRLEEELKRFWAKAGEFQSNITKQIDSQIVEIREEVQRLSTKLETVYLNLTEKLEASDSNISLIKSEMETLSKKVEDLNIGNQLTTSTTDTPVTPQSIDHLESIDIGTYFARLAVFKNLNYVATGYNDGLQIYDLSTKQLVRSINTSRANDLKAFKENQLIQASDNGQIKIWNVETGELVKTLEGHTDEVVSIALNKDQSLMLSADWGSDQIKLWNMTNFQEIRTFTGHEGDVNCVIFNEAKNQVISGSDDQTIRIWNISDGSLVKVLTGPNFWVKTLVLDEQTGRLYSANKYKMILEWDIDEGVLVKVFKGHDNNINDLILVDDQRIISTGHGTSVMIWSKKSGKAIKQLNLTSEVYEIAFGPSNDHLICTADNKLIFWPLKDMLENLSNDPMNEYESIDINSIAGRIAILKNQNWVATGYRYGVEIYDLRNKQLVRSLDRSRACDFKPFKENQLIQGSYNGEIKIWNVETGELLRTLEGHTDDVHCIALNKNQSLMLSGDWGTNIIKLWNTEDFSEIRTFVGHQSYVNHVIFNEAKDQVISASNDETIRVWNINDGSLIRTLTGHTFWVNTVLLDEQTGLLYSAAYDQAIKVWNVDNGTLLNTFIGHSNYVHRLMLVEDKLLSTSEDNSIIVWSKSGEIIKRFNYPHQLYSLDLNPSNLELLCTTGDEKLFFWPLKDVLE